MTNLEWLTQLPPGDAAGYLGTYCPLQPERYCCDGCKFHFAPKECEIVTDVVTKMVEWLAREHRKEVEG